MVVSIVFLHALSLILRVKYKIDRHLACLFLVEMPCFSPSRCHPLTCDLNQT